MTTIIILDPDQIMHSERTFLDQILDRIVDWGDEPDTFTGIHVRPRENGGWMEWVVVRYAASDGCYKPGSMAVGAIQRQPGFKAEFHS